MLLTMMLSPSPLAWALPLPCGLLLPTTFCCTAVCTQAMLPSPAWVTVCASAGTAAAITIAITAANNINFFNSASSYLKSALTATHFFISNPHCQHRCHYFLPFPYNFLTIGCRQVWGGF